MRRLIPAAVAVLAFALAGPARADVRVTLAPETTPAQVRSSNAYLIHAESDEPVTLADLLVLLPGHGQPCGQADEYGYPYGGDPSTNFSVPPQPGVSVSGRWVTISGPFLVDPTSPLDYRLAVTLPDIAACFYAGSTADLDPSSPQVLVIGTAQGGELDVVQHESFATGGYFSWEPRHWTLYWYAYTATAGCVEQWRLGLPAGFTLIDSSLGAGKLRSVSSFSEQWKTERCLAAGDSAYEWVVVSTTLCSNQGATVHARLRVWRDDGVIAGTGDGPALDLPPC